MNMKKSTLRIFVFTGGFVGIIILLFLYGRKQTYTQIETNMLTLFEESIRLDYEKRNVFPIFTYTEDSVSTEGNDSIMVLQSEEGKTLIKKAECYRKKSQTERAYIVIQLFLAEMNPIHPQALDSLYNSLLQEEHIPAQTAISYEYEGQISYSSQHSSFYATAYALPNVFIGVNEEYGLTLQAFVKVPGWYVGKVFIQKYGYTIGISSLILLGLFYLWYAFYKKRNNILPLPPTPQDLKQLTEGLLFDEMHGILIYEEKKIALTNYKLKLFDLLLQHKGFYLTSDFIRQTLWPEGTSSKEALTQTVKRLRAELEPIPVISIQSARNKGYCLTLIPLSQEEKAGQVLS